MNEIDQFKNELHQVKVANLTRLERLTLAQLKLRYMEWDSEVLGKQPDGLGERYEDGWIDWYWALRRYIETPRTEESRFLLNHMMCIEPMTLQKYLRDCEISSEKRHKPCNSCYNTSDSRYDAEANHDRIRTMIILLLINSITLVCQLVILFTTLFKFVIH